MQEDDIRRALVAEIKQELALMRTCATVPLRAKQAEMMQLRIGQALDALAFCGVASQAAELTGLRRNRADHCGDGV